MELQAGEALREVLAKAKDEGRLTHGIYECATLLGKDPDSVLLCFLADNSLGDVALHMHFTLIEAFCWENEIRLMKVEGHQELVKILSDVNDNTPAVPNSEGQTAPVNPHEFCCITLQCQHEAEKETALETLLEYYRVMSDVTPYPLVTLNK
ncbi:growth arrest and DNA damage-inducible protein GADD45 alpha-like isoform X2 [Ptychodera flava]